MKSGATIKFLFFILALCLISCKTVNEMAIEIQEPAPITLPISVQNIIVLNNTIVQPIDHGIERTYDEKEVAKDTYPLSLDSAVWATIGTFSNILEKSDFFNVVSYYKEAIRDDDEWLSISMLSKQTQDDFYDLGNCDAIISIDRLLFKVNEKVKKNMGSYSINDNVFIDAKVEAVVTASVYIQGKDKPITTFSAVDSLIFKSTFQADPALVLKEIPEFMIQNLALDFGELLAYKFIPDWKVVKRFMYTGYDSRMKEAYSYAKSQRWSEAEQLWSIELEKKDKPVDKARIASNIALAKEMQDNLEEAHKWATRSKEYFTQAGIQDQDIQMLRITEYITSLEDRMVKNHLLDIQWGTADEF